MTDTRGQETDRQHAGGTERQYERETEALGETAAETHRATTDGERQRCWKKKTERARRRGWHRNTQGSSRQTSRDRESEKERQLNQETETAKTKRDRDR